MYLGRDVCLVRRLSSGNEREEGLPVMGGGWLSGVIGGSWRNEIVGLWG